MVLDFSKEAMKEKEQTKDEWFEEQEFIGKYLKFKESCVSAKIFDIDEIIKLFEVWINS